MEIKLNVSKEKNIEKLNELTNDPAFVVSILKNMGYNKFPDIVSISIRLIKIKKDEKTDN